MPLQQINWSQIDTQNIPSGSSVIIASQLYPLEKLFIKELITSGAIVVSGSIETDGDLIISGAILLNGDRPILEHEFNAYTSSLVIGENIWWKTGSHFNTTNDLQITGSVQIRGDLIVEGQTVMVNPNINNDTLIVSGVLNLVKNEINEHTRLATLKIQGLGELGDTGKASTIDMGDGFF
jgi:cytoskeletal protein CcmA (bactofilin family)